MDYIPEYKHLPALSWNFLTPIYDAANSLIGFGKPFFRKVLNVSKLRDGEMLVDVGCATGVLLRLAKKRFPRSVVIGVDPDKKALQIARKNLLRAGLDAKLVQAFAEHMPLEDAIADVVVSSLAFHHMPDEAKRGAVREIYRILKPGGRVLIADFGSMNTHSIFFRIFRRLEHLEGNLRGHIPGYLSEYGFRSAQVVARRFPGVAMIEARKPKRHHLT